MTDLDRLKAEMERQDREFEACFEEMRALDPDLVLAASPELIEGLQSTAEPVPAPTGWSLRA